MPLDYLLYFLYIVPSQLKCLHICHCNFDMSTVDFFCGGKHNKVCGKKWVALPLLAFIFSPACLSYLSELFWVTLVLLTFVYVGLFRNLGMVFSFNPFPFSVHSNTICCV